MNSKSCPVAICDNCGRYLHFCFCKYCARDCDCVFCKKNNPEPKPIKNITIRSFCDDTLHIYTADENIRGKVLKVVHKYGSVGNKTEFITLSVNPCYSTKDVQTYIENLA